jgi:hypothetical protein
MAAGMSFRKSAHIQGVAMLIALLCGASRSVASEATVIVDNLATEFFGLSATVHGTRSVHLDLSGLGDLVPGETIRLTLSATAPLYWLGGFTHGSSGLAFEHHVVLELSVGIYSVNGSYDWRTPEVGFFDPGGPPPPNTSDVFGFSAGPRPGELTLLVPSGTNLSDVQVRLTEDSLITGGSSYIQSGVAFSGQAGAIGSAPVLHVESVPEPNAFVLLTAGLAAAGGLRRRKPTAVF